MRLFGFDIALQDDGILLTRAPAGLQTVHDNRGGWHSIVREPFTGAWQRNQEWTTDTVLAHHAVYACITRIAQDIGKLRPKLMERDDDGIWSEIENATHSPVLRRPNRFQNRIQFQESWAISKLSRGNTYVLIERDGRNVPRAYYILDPTRVTVLVAPDGSVFYQLDKDNLAGLEEDRLAVPASEIIHDRINCLYHPLVGTTPIFACGTAANMGLQIQQNQSGFFANGSNPSGILSAVTSITPEKSAQLSELWNARFGKDKSGGVAVLGDGMKFEPMRMNAVDSQLIQQLGWTAETVCSTFHVPAWKVGVGEQPAYTKPEIANQAYYSDCLQAHIEQWELCMDGAFGFDTTVDGRWLGVELDLDGLLRMDAASQVETLVAGIRGGLFTPNGARRKVDAKPVRGGDTIWMQQQDIPIEVAYDNALNPPKPEPAPAITAGEAPKQLTAGEKVEEAEEERSLEVWDGWFARDALTLVREAQAAQSRVVEESIEAQERAAFTDSTRAAIEQMTRTVQALAERETVVHVAPAQVHIAPTTVNVGTPDVHVAVTMQPEAGKTVTRTSKVIRGAVGEIAGVETTEVKD